MSPEQIIDKINEAVEAGDKAEAWEGIWKLLDDVVDSVRLTEDSRRIGPDRPSYALQDYLTHHYGDL